MVSDDHHTHVSVDGLRTIPELLIQHLNFKMFLGGGGGGPPPPPQFGSPPDPPSWRHTINGLTSFCPCAMALRSEYEVHDVCV